MQWLRLREIVLSLYLDDSLFVAKFKEQCEENMSKAIKLLEYIGFIINYKKSSLVARQTCKYLGFIIETSKFSLNLTDKKKNQILSLLNKFEIGKSFRIREFAEFLWILTSACPAVAYSFLHCKQLERQKFLALKFNGGNYEGKIRINESMKKDLIWWKSHAAIESLPIRTYQLKKKFFSNASLTGWGCLCEGGKSFGFWSNEEKRKHINYLELLAAFFAIK